MTGYWGDEKATKNTFDDYGYLKSGDVAQVFHLNFNFNFY